mmetsp:Transcript_7932/g.15915  ORF Transcript_7932/g.15915 Transcript_7932/m.15915 type:complete len:238 (-) Transcript_7932:143-856(-)
MRSVTDVPTNPRSVMRLCSWTTRCLCRLDRAQACIAAVYISTVIFRIPTPPSASPSTRSASSGNPPWPSALIMAVYMRADRPVTFIRWKTRYAFDTAVGDPSCFPALITVVRVTPSGSMPAVTMSSSSAMHFSMAPRRSTLLSFPSDLTRSAVADASTIFTTTFFAASKRVTASALPFLSIISLACMAVAAASTSPDDVRAFKCWIAACSHVAPASTTTASPTTLSIPARGVSAGAG